MFRNKKMKALLLIPPFTQINCVYPSVIELAGFLEEKGIDAVSLDLSLKTALKIFSKEGLSRIFREIRIQGSENQSVRRALMLEDQYIRVIDQVMHFLQGQDNGLSYRLSRDSFLPQGDSFRQDRNDSAAFGNMGDFDRAKHYSTLLIDDLTRIIQDSICPEFGLSRYAERIAVSLKTMDPLIERMGKRNLIDSFIEEETERALEKTKPSVLGYSIPFPGNLLGAMISAEKARRLFPEIKIIFGGGYANTELRQMSDARLFNYTDYLCFDQGEFPLYNIIKSIEAPGKEPMLTRTMHIVDGKIKYTDNSVNKFLPPKNSPAPSYKGINPDEYPALIEVLNPINRLWSDGFFNKLSLAYGCYWHKCTFCDTNLDYIKRYSPSTASRIADRMDASIRQTGRRNFHFTDEACPPKLLRELALEIIKRDLGVTYWGNIRFDDAFTSDLTRLLAFSGCIAVSGGLEACQDRLLNFMKKGVSIESSARVLNNFKGAGISVHAYLIYGFPTQTGQDIINALEILRQLFQNGLIQSAFWHRFSLTRHSPVYSDPEAYNIKIINDNLNSFANNDLEYQDLSGIKPDRFGTGLSLSTYNFMMGIGLENDPRSWFEFESPRPLLQKGLIEGILKEDQSRKNIPEEALIIWTGGQPEISSSYRGKIEFKASSNFLEGSWHLRGESAQWLCNFIEEALRAQNNGHPLTFKMLKDSFPESIEEFNKFLNTRAWKEIRENLLILI